MAECTAASSAAAAAPVLTSDICRLARGYAYLLGELARILPTLPLHIHAQHATVSIQKPIEDQGVTTLGKQFRKHFFSFDSVKSQELLAVRDIDIKIQPRKMTLVLSPPGHGKSTLLKLLSGQQTPTSGSVTFNGLSASQAASQPASHDQGVLINKLLHYVDQVDVLVPYLTVRETLQGVVDHSFDPSTLDDGISLQDKQSLVVLRQNKVAMIMKLLGLEECADTVVGNDLVRGLSGGQRKRLAMGEALCSDARALFLDEATNGLDASTAAAMMMSMRQWVDHLGGSCVAALLQPGLEIFHLFDDLILLREGEVVYNGPREQAVPYFQGLGFVCAPDQEEADFLLELLTDPSRVHCDQHAANRQPRRMPCDKEGHPSPSLTPSSSFASAPPTSTRQLVAAFRFSPLHHTHHHHHHHVPLHPDLVLPLARTTLNECNNSTHAPNQTLHPVLAAYYGGKYHHSLARHTAINCRHLWLLKWRDWESNVFRLFQALVRGLIIGTLFFQLPDDQYTTRVGLVNYLMGALSFSSMLDLFVTFESKKAALKRYRYRLYPLASYVVADFALGAPMAAIEALVFAAPVYWMSGFVPDVGRFAVFFLMVLVVNLSMMALFRLLIYIADHLEVAEGLATPVVGVVMLFGGYLIARPKVPYWFLWLYWISPYSWSNRSVLLNEFGSSRYDDLITIATNTANTANTANATTAADVTQRRGDVYADVWGLYTNEQYIWLGAVYQLVFIFVIACFAVLALKKARLETNRGTRRSPSSVTATATGAKLKLKMDVQTEGDLPIPIRTCQPLAGPSVPMPLSTARFAPVPSLSFGAGFARPHSVHPDPTVSPSTSMPARSVSSVGVSNTDTHAIQPASHPQFESAPSLAMAGHVGAALIDVGAPHLHDTAADGSEGTVYFHGSAPASRAGLLPPLRIERSRHRNFGAPFSGGDLHQPSHDKRFQPSAGTAASISDNCKEEAKHISGSDDDLEVNARSEPRPPSPSPSSSSPVGVELATVHRQQTLHVRPFRIRSVLPFTPLTLAFKDVCFSVMSSGNGIMMEERDRHKQLLRNVNGFARPGTLTALMGPSGAGKTTLLDVLSGRKTQGRVSGQILVNGHPKDPETFNRFAGYVEQQDHHIETETVFETLMLSAHLRLPASVTAPERRQMVEEVMQLLELESVRERCVGGGDCGSGLSPGQLKRVTMAVELVANPSILFLDEPTTGLDATNCLHIVKVIRQIASTGRAVVCTIHQPSAEVFSQFDRVLLLQSGGFPVFFGELGEVEPFLSAIPGVLPCPNGLNPAVWMLDVIGSDLDDDEGGGRQPVTVDFLKRQASLAPYQRVTNSTLDPSVKTVDSNPKPAALAALLPPEPVCVASVPVTLHNHDRNKTDSFNQHYLRSPLHHRNEIEMELASSLSSQVWSGSKRARSFWVQYFHVQMRFFRSYWRNVPFNYTRFLVSFVPSLLLGMIWFQIDAGDLVGFTSKMSGMNIGIMFNVTVSGSPQMHVLFHNRPTFYREQISRTYSSFAYSASMMVIEVIYVAISSLIFVTPMYLLMGMNYNFTAFFQYYFGHCLLHLSMSFLAQLHIAVFPSVPTAQVLFDLFYAVQFLFGGIFVPGPLIPRGWKWFFDVNPVRYCLQMMYISQFSCGEDCPSLSMVVGSQTVTKTTKEFLQSTYGIDFDGYWWPSVSFFLIYMVTVHVLMSLALRFLRRIKR